MHGVSDEPAGGPQQIKSVHKAFDILEALAASRTPLRITDLAEQLRMTPSTVSRLVATLREHGLVETDPLTGRCTVGLGAVVLGNAALGRRPLDQITRPWIAQLSTQFSEYINISQLHRGKVVYQRGTWSDGMMRAGVRLSGILPVHSTSPGKVLIAWLPEAEIRSILHGTGMESFTANTITDIDAMLAHLAEVRRLGLAHDREEIAYNLIGAAAPIRGADGRVLASISTSMAAGRWQKKAIEVEQALIYAAAQISRDLGHVPAPQENGVRMPG